jgi:hypothetical protein
VVRSRPCIALASVMPSTIAAWGRYSLTRPGQPAKLCQRRAYRPQRGTCLMTQRSQVQILPPLLRNPLSEPDCCECNRALIIFVSHSLANVAVPDSRPDCAIGGRGDAELAGPSTEILMSTVTPPNRTGFSRCPEHQSGRFRLFPMSVSPPERFTLLRGISRAAGSKPSVFAAQRARRREGRTARANPGSAV